MGLRWWISGNGERAERKDAEAIPSTFSYLD